MGFKIVPESNSVPFEEPLARRFWPAFAAFVEQLMQVGHLSAAFGFSGSCGNQGGCDPEQLSQAIREQAGLEAWPVNNPSTLSITEILSTVEFLRSRVALPEWSTCGWCEQQHVVGGDAEAAATAFDERVNEMFRRFGLAYRLANGTVHRVNSEIALAFLKGTEKLTTDPELQRLLDAASGDFFGAKEDRRLQGLFAIVDAFERVKATLHADKRRSIELLVAALSPEPELAVTFNNLLQNLTTIGNRYSIRHHEPTQVPLADAAVVEFLFFAYFNVVRFALSRVADGGAA